NRTVQSMSRGERYLVMGSGARQKSLPTPGGYPGRGSDGRREREGAVCLVTRQIHRGGPVPGSPSPKAATVRVWFCCHWVTRSFLSKWALSTSRTMAAANCPWPPCSNNATTTISGLSRGANPTNQALSLMSSPPPAGLTYSLDANCEVPVL